MKIGVFLFGTHYRLSFDNEEKIYQIWISAAVIISPRFRYPPNLKALRNH